MSAHPASNPAPGVKFVLGIAKKAGKSVSQIQSVIFDKLKWSKDTAKKWLREQGFTSTTPESAATYWRFRQKSPAKYKRFATIEPGRKNPLTLQNLHLIEHHAKDAASSYRGKRAPSSSVVDKGFREAMKHLKSELGKVTAADRKQYRGVYFRAFRSAVKNPVASAHPSYA